MTKQRMAMRSNFPWSGFKKLGTPELSSSSSTSTALSLKNFEKRAHPNEELMGTQELMVIQESLIMFASNFTFDTGKGKMFRNLKVIKYVVRTFEF